ncbi:hypothetical protein ACIPYS_02850 [Kitasatospora sp. NPDC089913]|uniref:hypothetical protein n=1 Tax=Kitasatospora sp. NPDC089913 TaxID=3364080 RepID=UPI0037F33879
MGDPGRRRHHLERPFEVLETVNVIVPDGLLIPDLVVADAEAAAGIPHYWRIELEPAPRLCLGHLERGLYVDRLVQVGETARLDDPFALSLDPARLRR